MNSKKHIAEFQKALQLALEQSALDQHEAIARGLNFFTAMAVETAPSEEVAMFRIECSTSVALINWRILEARNDH